MPQGGANRRAVLSSGTISADLPLRAASIRLPIASAAARVDATLGQPGFQIPLLARAAAKGERCGIRSIARFTAGLRTGTMPSADRLRTPPSKPKTSTKSNLLGHADASDGRPRLI